MELLKQKHVQYTEPAPWRKPPRGASLRLKEKKKKKRLILMEMILQIKNVSLVAKWGFFCWQCPAKQGQQALPIQTNTNPPKALCPRCQKGHHWAKDCRSKFHKDGTTLTPQVEGGNFSQFQGNGQQGKPQPWTTIGAAALNPIVSFVPSQNSSEQPHVEQDWTSVPPPQQY